MEQPDLEAEKAPESNEKSETVGPEIVFMRYFLRAEVKVLRVVCAYLPLPLQQLVHSLFLILVVEIGFQCYELIRSGYLAAGVVLYSIYTSVLLVLISQGIYILCLRRKSAMEETRGMINIVVSQARNDSAHVEDSSSNRDGVYLFGDVDKVRATAQSNPVVVSPSLSPSPPPMMMMLPEDDKADTDSHSNSIASHIHTYTAEPLPSSTASSVEKTAARIAPAAAHEFNLSDSDSDSQDFQYLRRFLIDAEDDYDEGEGDDENEMWITLGMIKEKQSYYIYLTLLGVITKGEVNVLCCAYNKVRGRRLTHTENGHLCPLLCPFFRGPAAN